MPGTVEVTGCNIKNMRARIVTVGVRSPNDSNFVARALELGLAAETIKAFNQSIRRQISLYVHDNRVKNDIIITKGLINHVSRNLQLVGKSYGCIVRL